MSLPSLVFTVERSAPELISPAKPTPYEFKLLSDIDDQKGLRKHTKAIMFYKNVVGMEGRDPVKVIKDAIAKALVYYYPFAGRVLDGPNDKLMVECTGKGVLFIEANADVRLEQFGDVLRPPFPGAEDLLYDVPGSAGILHCPLLLIQVTRLICGGFTFAFRNNHTMADATGMVQFMKAVGEIACGADIPSVKPVWKRELLNARKPPQVSCLHRVYIEVQDYKVMPSDNVNQFAQRSFFFSLKQITNLKNHLPSDLQKCSNFEILTANLWQCRTVALGLNSDDEVRLAFPINARSRVNPALPVGFYGNALAYTVAQTTSGLLCQMSLGNVLMLVKTAINDVTNEFIRSSVDFLVQNGRPIFKFERTFFLSDLTRMGFKDIDFGWGKPIYGGPILGGPPSFFVSSKNNKGEDGIAVTLYLPETNMDRLAMEIDKIFSLSDDTKSSSYIVSPL